MSYFYQLVLGDYDSYNEAKLSFPEKLSDQAFREYVHKATISALNYVVEHPDEISWPILGAGPTLEDLLPIILKELKAQGFESASPFAVKLNYSGCGNGILRESSGPENKLLQASIPQDLKQKILDLAKAQAEKQMAKVQKI